MLEGLWGFQKDFPCGASCEDASFVSMTKIAQSVRTLLQTLCVLTKKIKFARKH